MDSKMSVSIPNFVLFVNSLLLMKNLKITNLDNLQLENPMMCI